MTSLRRPVPATIEGARAVGPARRNWRPTPVRCVKDPPVDLRPPLVTMTHDLPPRCPTSSTAAGGRSSRSWMAGST